MRRKPNIVSIATTRSPAMIRYILSNDKLNIPAKTMPAKTSFVKSRTYLPPSIISCLLISFSFCLIASTKH